MNYKWINLLFTLCAAMTAAGCSSENDDDNGGNGNDGGNGGSTPPIEAVGGYADPDGVLILNQGAPSMENGTVTWIAPDGTVEEDVYGKVNGSAVGNTSQDLCMYGGKIYILSNNSDVPYLGSGEAGDGTLVIVDAETFQKEKAFKFEDLKYPRPEGSTDENETLPLISPLGNITVLDEHNIYLSDSKAMFRLDATTGEMTIVEGSYHSATAALRSNRSSPLAAWLSSATGSIAAEADSGPTRNSSNLPKERVK